MTEDLKPGPTMEDFEPVPDKQFIGRGGFGVVELLRYKSDPQKFVACKTIQYSDTGSRNSKKQDIEREYTILSKLRHPNIVQYIHFEWYPREAKLCMEYCKGGSLEDYIARQKELKVKTSEAFVWKVSGQLASALMYCHYGVTSEEETINGKECEGRVLHRDIKPGNVLLSSDLDGDLDAAFTAKLGDFGLGVTLHGNNAPNTYVGTKQYTAPEINRTVETIAWTDKCDIFSLGCTLHTLCNDSPPFEYRMESEDELKPDSFSDEYSTDLRDFIMDCLSYKPESRPDAIKVHKIVEEQLKTVDQARPAKLLVGHKKGKLLPGAPIAATCWPGWHYRVYFQDSSGGIREARHDVGVWAGGDTSSAICHAKLFTPLAVVSSSKGKEIRVFYLTEQDILQERCYSAGSGWRPGSLNKLMIKASPYSRITALWLSSGIRVYYQEPTKNTLQEYYLNVDTTWRRHFKRSGPTWREGTTLHADALRGTSLASATWGGDSIRLYYQDTSLELREHCCDGVGKGWYVGHLSVGTMPKHTPISSFAWYDQNTSIQIRVYWHDAAKNLVELKWSGGWQPVQEVVYMGTTQFSAVQWQNGNHIRAYYQGPDHAVMEKCFSNTGDWYNGSRVGVSGD